MMRIRIRIWSQAVFVEEAELFSLSILSEIVFEVRHQKVKRIDVVTSISQWDLLLWGIGEWLFFLYLQVLSLWPHTCAEAGRFWLFYLCWGQFCSNMPRCCLRLCSWHTSHKYLRKHKKVVNTKRCCRVHFAFCFFVNMINFSAYFAGYLSYPRDKSA